jgi:hypothetical protein
MKRSIGTVVLSVLCLSAGCGTVTLHEPLGEKIPPAELKQLEGTWAGKNGSTIAVRLNRAGNLAFAALEWDDQKEEFEAENVLVVATQSDDLKLLQLFDSAKKHYVLFRWKFEDADTAHIYLPDATVFEQAVKEGKLSGTIHREKHALDVNLDAESKKVLAFITAIGADKCFQKESSTTFHRIRRQ